MFRSRLLGFGMAVAAHFGLLASTYSDEFQRHAVVAEEALGARAGLEILRRGGNAVDASIATAFALAVTHPAAGNLGGGGFLLAFDAKSGHVECFEFRESAPSASNPRMYLDDAGKLRVGHRSGARAAGVPGTVRGLELAHRTRGTRPWSELVEPAVVLAREGFEVSERLARSLNSQLEPLALDPANGQNAPAPLGRLANYPTSVKAFAKADGTAWVKGDRLIQPDLADTLERIARLGASEFYEGRTADLIATYCAGQGGLITREDLAEYRANQRIATHVTFRGHDVYGAGPPSSGGVVVGLALNILEPMNLRSQGPDDPLTVHRVTEAMRRAFLVRATKIADPDFEPIALDKLLSKAYAGQLAATIDDEKASSSVDLAPGLVSIDPPHTTHFSCVDSFGNAVALTYTLEDSYGSKAVVAGAGFLLNNEMGDFNLTPGLTDTSGTVGTSPNLIAAKKRMLSSQSPTIVLKDGKVRLVTGSPGGRTIPSTVLWVLLRTLEFDQPLDEAVDSPRTHHQWLPDQLWLEGTAWSPEIRERLGKLGHSVVTIGLQGNANSIAIDLNTGRIHAKADTRRGAAGPAGE
jgi:gamma-glutamyltranspeptidase/glutathione hydrolase